MEFIPSTLAEVKQIFTAIDFKSNIGYRYLANEQEACPYPFDIIAGAYQKIVKSLDGSPWEGDGDPPDELVYLVGEDGIRELCLLPFEGVTAIKGDLQECEIELGGDDSEILWIKREALPEEEIAIYLTFTKSRARSVQAQAAREVAEAEQRAAREVEELRLRVAREVREEIERLKCEGEDPSETVLRHKAEEAKDLAYFQAILKPVSLSTVYGESCQRAPGPAELPLPAPQGTAELPQPAPEEAAAPLRVVGRGLKLAWLPAELYESSSFQKLNLGAQELYRIYRTYCKLAGGESLNSYIRIGEAQAAGLLERRKKDMLGSGNPATRKAAKNIGVSVWSIERNSLALQKAGWIVKIIRGRPAEGNPFVNKFLVVKSEKQRLTRILEGKKKVKH